MTGTSDFWLLVGTAAPVLLVTNVVAYGQINDAIIDSGLASNPAITREHGGRRRLRPFLSAAFTLGCALALNSAALIVAMADLTTRTDGFPPFLGFLLIGGALLTMLISLALTYNARKSVRRPTRDEPAD